MTEWLLGLWETIKTWFTSGAAQVWFTNNIMPLIWSLLGIIGSVLATRLITKTFNWLDAKTQNEKGKKMITKIKNIISSCTNATSQSYVCDMKKAGKFDLNAQKTALNMTLSNIKDQLTSEAKTYIKNEFKDLDTYLTTQVESEIDDDHKEQASNSIH